MDSIKNDDDEIILKVNLIRALQPFVEKLKINLENIRTVDINETNNSINNLLEIFKGDLLEVIDRREFKNESELKCIISNIRQVIENIQTTNNNFDNKNLINKIRIMFDEKENESSLSPVSVSENSMHIIEKISKSLNDLDKENSKIQKIIEKQFREEEKLVNIENLLEPSNELIKNINKINHSEVDLLKTLIEPIETVKEAIFEIKNQSDDHQGYIDINDTKNKNIMKNITRSISDLKTVLEIMQSQIESSEDMAGTLEDMTNLEALANHLQELKDRLVIVMKETPLMELNKYPRNDITRNVFETIQKPVENLNNGLMKIENYALEPVVNEWTAREVLKGITKPIEDLLIGISKIKDSFPMSELIKIPTLELVEKLIKPLESVEKGIAALTIKEFPDERFSDEDSYMSEGTTLASISEITNEEASMGYDTVLEPIFQKKSATTADRSKSNSSTGENNIYSPKELQKVLREKTLSPQNSRSDEETCKKGDIVDKLKDQQSSSDNALNGGSLSLTGVTSISYDKPTEINEDMASESEKTLLNSYTQQKEKKNLTSDKLISDVSNLNSEKLNISQQQALTHKADLIDSLIKKENIIKEILQVSETQKPITVELKSHLAEKAEIIKELLKTETKIDTELNKSLSETQNIVPDDLKSAQSLSQEDKEKLVKEVEVIEKICNNQGMKIETLKQAEAQFAQTHEVEKLIEKAKIIDEILHKDNVAFEELQKLHTRTEDISKVALQGILHEQDQSKDSENMLDKENLNQVSIEDLKAHKLNVNQEQALSHKAELIDSLVKEENIIKEILKISEAQKPITIELKSHLAEKAEIIKELLEAETKIDTELNKSFSETQKIALNDLKSAQSLSQDDKEKLVKEVEVIENICNKKEMKIEALKQAETQFAQTHEVENLVQKARIIEGILQKENVAFGDLQKLHMTEDIDKEVLQGKLNEQEQSEDNEKMRYKDSLTEVPIGDLKEHQLNYSQKQVLSHKAELIDSLQNEEKIINELLLVSEAQKPITVELKSHLAEKAEIIKELLETETKIDAELNKSFNETQNIVLGDLKSAQSLSQEDKEKLVKEVEVIEKIYNNQGIKIETLKQAEAQFAQTHEVENLIEKAKIIDDMLHKDNVAFGELQKLHTRTEDISKEALQGILHEQDQSKGSENLDKENLTQVSIDDLKAHKLNVSQEQVLSHKAELIDSLVKEENIIKEILKISEAQKPITIELKSHLAEKAEIIKELLETETKIDAELTKSFKETQDIVLYDLKSAQSLSQEDKEKLVKEVEVIEKICNRKGMKIETLKQAEAQFAQTHEVEKLIEKAKIIDEILHKDNVAFEELQKLHTRTEDISKVALQGILHEQDQSKDSENMLDKENLNQVSIEDLKAHKLNVNQEQALSHKAELIDSLVKEENIIKEILKISEAQKPITIELKSHLAEKAEIIKELLEAETKIDTELNKSFSETQKIALNDLKSAQSLSQDDKEKLVKEVEVIENICNKKEMKIEALKQAETQFAQTHEVENLVQKARIIEGILQKENVAFGDLQKLHMTEDIDKEVLQGKLNEQEQSEDNEKMRYKDSLTEVPIGDLKEHQLNYSQKQVLSHKAELIDSLQNEEKIINELLLVSEAQKPITVELKSHLAEKAEIIKELLETETKIDAELNKSFNETQNIVLGDLKSAQSLSQEDKEKLVKEVEVIEKIYNNQGIKIETLKQAEAQFAQTHEVENLIEKAKIIDDMLHKDNVAFGELQKLHTRTEDISKEALQGILHEQDQSKGSENLDKENLTQVSIDDLKAHKLNVSQEQVLSHKAELIDSLVKEENIIKEILKISEAQKPITIELKSHLAEKAEIIKELLETETKIDAELTKSFKETQDIVLYDLKSAQSLSQEEKEKLVKEVEVIEKICNNQGIKIETLKQAEAQFAQTHEVENLIEKAGIIVSILHKKDVELVDLKIIHAKTEDIGKVALQGTLDEQEPTYKEDLKKVCYAEVPQEELKVLKLNINQKQALSQKVELINALANEENIVRELLQQSETQNPLTTYEEDLKKVCYAEVPQEELKVLKLNINQKQALSQKAELINALVNEENIVRELLQQSETQNPLTVELKSHLAEKADIIKDLLETETIVDKELSKELKPLQALCPDDKEKLLKEVEVIGNLCNQSGMKIETLKQAEAQFAQTHEIENLIGKAKIIDHMLQTEDVELKDLKTLYAKIEDTGKVALQGKLQEQEESLEEKLKLNVRQEQALSHKVDLIHSLAKEENIIREILQISEAQKPITMELKTHLAEKAEIIKDLLKTETTLDKELNKNMEEKQNLNDMKSIQALSQDDKEKLLKEVEVIENVCNKKGIKIEALKQAEAQFAQTHEVENLVAKAEIIESILQKESVEPGDLKPHHLTIENIENLMQQVKVIEVLLNVEVGEGELLHVRALQQLTPTQISELSQKKKEIKNVMKLSAETLSNETEMGKLNSQRNKLAETAELIESLLTLEERNFNQGFLEDDPQYSSEEQKRETN
ncbi:golgin subfamily B member 1-like [Diaphorina citri]|uniref:Golgin subfamily B member 1-like n=1 Tax=Diaphorina citri TaxID=121845 RepID=A0A3Q0IPB0_DIACI|nr:golgin subfamily B member 1-like [Diaphorina citri]